MIDLTLKNPHQTITEVIAFLKETYARAGKKKAVVAVSGGIDSAVALTLVTEALGPQQVWPLLLPYGDQSLADSEAIIAVNRIPKSHWRTIQIKPIVESILHATVQITNQAIHQTTAQTPNQVINQTTNPAADQLRLGNIMARVRMIMVYDAAKELDALVCGTENKSEKYLAYFTRFGDEASDVEPIQHLYKTQVRQLATALNLPEQFVTKPPSAGLWAGQTDEDELGFSYQQADLVIESYLQHTSGNVSDITQFLATTISEETGMALELVEAVLKRVHGYDFKHQVPYTL